MQEDSEVGKNENGTAKEKSEASSEDSRKKGCPEMDGLF